MASLLTICTISAIFLVVFGLTPTPIPDEKKPALIPRPLPLPPKPTTDLSDAKPPADVPYTPPTGKAASRARSAVRGGRGALLKSVKAEGAAEPTLSNAAAASASLSVARRSSRALNGVFILCERRGYAPTATVLTHSGPITSTATRGCFRRHVRGSRWGGPSKWNHARLWPLGYQYFSGLTHYYEKQYSCRGWGTVYVLKKYWFGWWAVHACRPGYEAHVVDFRVRY